MRIAILLTRLMNLHHIVQVPILRRTRKVHTIETVRRQDTLSTRTMDTMVTFEKKVQDLILQMSPTTKVVRLHPTISELEQSTSEALSGDYRSIHSTVVALRSSLSWAGLLEEIAIRPRPVSEPLPEESETSRLVSSR
jgi:hypothetical protein